jgi:hypothetical protein
VIPETLSRLTHVRKKTFDLIDGCSQEAFDQKPAKCSLLLGEAGSWNAGEVLDHIVKVMESLGGEVGTLIALKLSGEEPVLSRGIAEYDVSPVFIPKQLMPLAESFFKIGNQFASAFLPSSVRESIIRTRTFPIRNPSQWIPASGRSIADLRADLEASMMKLEGMIEAHPEITFDELVLDHSIFGRHTVPQLLEVLSLHEEWHQPDIERILSGA